MVNGVVVATGGHDEYGLDLNRLGNNLRKGLGHAGRYYSGACTVAGQDSNSAAGDLQAALLIVFWLSAAPLDVFNCGIVGAQHGWLKKHILCRCTFGPTSHRTDTCIRVRVLPGLKQNHPEDGLRGKEIQTAGYPATHPHWDGVICLPGTHAKWAQFSAEEVICFGAFMTG